MLIVFAFRRNYFQLSAVIVTQNYSQQTKHHRTISYDSFIHSFIHSVGCLTTDPQAILKRALQRARSSASSFNFQYPVFLKAIQQLLTSSSSSSRYFYPSLYLSLNNIFQKAVPSQDVNKSVSLLSLYCTKDIPLLLGSYVTLHFLPKDFKYYIGKMQVSQSQATSCKTVLRFAARKGTLLFASTSNTALGASNSIQ